MNQDLKYVKKRVDQLEGEVRIVLSGRPMADVVVVLISLLAESISISTEPKDALKQAIEHVSELVDIHTTPPSIDKGKMN